VTEELISFVNTQIISYATIYWKRQQGIFWLQFYSTRDRNKPLYCIV